MACDGLVLFLSRRSFSLKTAYSARNGAPTKAEERFPCLFVVEMAQPVPTKGFLSTARQDSYYRYSMS